MTCPDNVQRWTTVMPDAFGGNFTNIIYGPHQWIELHASKDSFDVPKTRDPFRFYGCQFCLEKRIEYLS